MQVTVLKMDTEEYGAKGGAEEGRFILCWSRSSDSCGYEDRLILASQHLHPPSSTMLPAFVFT
jgi:hypothetical protein